MAELRKDYILDCWTIIAAKRGLRPHQFKKSIPKMPKVCYFCPGNENLTPDEIGRVEEKGKWKIRWFPNKFPAVDKPGKNNKGKAVGYHEVLVETPNHKLLLDDLPPEHIAQVLKVYALRIKELSKKKGIKYVQVFKNQGESAGTSIIHTHTQIVALNMIPTAVQQEVDASKKTKSCPYCRVIKKEEKSKRKTWSSKNVVAFAPYASRFNYESWIFPRKHMTSITQMDDGMLLEMAQALKHHIMKLRQLNADYNFFLHYAPKGEDLHFHIEITPRIAKWAGFEHGTGITINAVAPELAAKFYRQ